MKHLLRTMNGQQYEITDEQREKLATILLSKKADRPSFIEIGELGAIIAVSSISSIEKKATW